MDILAHTALAQPFPLPSWLSLSQSYPDSFLAGLSGPKFRVTTKRSIVKRLVVAAILTLVTLVLWPRPFVSYIYFSEASRIRHSVQEGILDFLDAEVKANIPRGEVELRKLPEEVADQMFLTIDRERGTDGWGHPYMFVAEDRADGLWIRMFFNGSRRPLQLEG